LGGGYRLVVERTADTAYGRRGGSLYPVVLVLVTAVALAATGALVPAGVGVISLLLLAIWVGGSGRR
jgi:hypothetical protein